VTPKSTEETAHFLLKHILPAKRISISPESYSSHFIACFEEIKQFEYFGQQIKNQFVFYQD